MRALTSLVPGFTLLAAGMLSGCIVTHDHIHDGVPPTCDVPAPVAYSGSFMQDDVEPDASTEIAAGDAGFAVTANGAGTYRLTWTDTTGAATCFTGRITGIDDFSETQVTGYSGHELFDFISPNQIGFASAPGTDIDGIDFFATQDPIYIDVYADGSQQVNIYYTDTTTELVTTTDVNPVAFKSP